MNCIKCSKNAVAGGLCRSHFIELAERRAKEAIRDMGWLKRNEKVLVVNDGTANGVASEYLLKKVVGGLPLKITVRKTAGNTKGFGRVVIPHSLDDEIEMFLEELSEGKKAKRDKRELLLLRHLNDDELEQFLRLKGLKFKQRKKSELGLLLSKLEQRLPKTRFALARASESFRKILAKA